MKVNILHGTAAPAIRKAEIYAASIRKAGHQVVFNQEEADEHVCCNEHLHRKWLELTGQTDSILAYAGDKLLCGKGLPEPYSRPFTSANLDDFENRRFIAKQRYGSGATKAHLWSYELFDSKAHFNDKYFKEEYHQQWYEDFQTNCPSVLGPYVYQEYLPGSLLHDCFYNDGNGVKHFMTMVTHYEDERVIWLEGDLHDKKANIPIPPGTFLVLQYFLGEDGRRLVVDMNVRSSSIWDLVYPRVAPNFYDVFFDNWLNKRDNSYLVNYPQFTLDRTGIPIQYIEHLTYMHPQLGFVL